MKVIPTWSPPLPHVLQSFLTQLEETWTIHIYVSFWNCLIYSSWLFLHCLGLFLMLIQISTQPKTWGNPHETLLSIPLCVSSSSTMLCSQNSGNLPLNSLSFESSMQQTCLFEVFLSVLWSGNCFHTFNLWKHRANLV